MARRGLHNEGSEILNERLNGKVDIDLTLTSPGCPMGPQMIRDVRTELAHLPGIEKVDVDLVWSPPWHPSMMSDAAKDELGYDEDLGLGYTR